MTRAVVFRHVVHWLDEAAPSLAQLIMGACSIIDFPSVLIDGNMPEDLRQQLVDRVACELGQVPMSGLIKPEVVEGSMGPSARPLGAASIPLSKKFLLDG